MPSLSEYSNVYDTALAHLRERGFQLWFDEATGMYFAERDGWDLAAETPVSLLGLAAILESKDPEEYAEYWWRDEAGPDYRELPRAPREYTSVVARRRQND